MSRRLVSKVVKHRNGPIIHHERIQTCEHYGERPDASYRVVVEQVDVLVEISTDWIKPERRIGVPPLTVSFLER